jgi:hypothetical protein
MARTVSPLDAVLSLVPHGHIVRIVPLLAVGTSAVVRISACIQCALSQVKHHVIGAILADDQVPPAVVCALSIYMVNFCFWRKRMPERLFRNDHVLKRPISENDIPLR